MFSFQWMYRWVLVVLFSAVAPFAMADTAHDNSVRAELIDQMFKDGYLQAQQATEASVKYTGEARASSWKELLTWSAMLKTAGILLFVVAFWKTLALIPKHLFLLLMQVPRQVYQALFLTASIGVMLYPEMVFPTQVFYVVLFNSIALLSIVMWIILTNKPVEAFLQAITKPLGDTVTSLLFGSALTAYFLYFTMGYQSQIFGLLTMIFATCTLMVAIGSVWTPKSNTGHYLVVAGCLPFLLAFQFASQQAVSSQYYQMSAWFALGAHYYLPLILSIAFFFGSAPEQRGVHPFITLMMFCGFAVGMGWAYAMYNHQVAGSIVMVGAVLAVMHWIFYWSFKNLGVIGGLFIGGSVLFGAGVYLERFIPMLKWTLQ